MACGSGGMFVQSIKFIQRHQGNILANGALSAGGQETEIRKNLIEEDLVDCILYMPSNLFQIVTIPCSIWILNRNKKQKGKILFIDYRNLGTMVTRKLKELSEEEVL